MARTWTLPEALTAWTRRRDAARTHEAQALHQTLLTMQAAIMGGQFTKPEQVQRANDLLSGVAGRVERLSRPELEPRPRISRGEAIWLAAGSGMAAVKRHYAVEGEDE